MFTLRPNVVSGFPFHSDTTAFTWEIHTVGTMADASRVQNNVREKVPKYRASCDSCNEAKVRCSQTRPSCARCLKSQNRRCVYGVSKRSGKHSGGDGSLKMEGGAKIGTMARQPATPSSTPGTETPSSSASTIDPREFLQLYPASEADSPDMLKGQHMSKDWTFDNNLFMPTQSATSQGSPVNFDHYQLMFGRDENHMSNVQHGLGLFDDVSDAELGSCSRNDSLSEQPPSYTQSNNKCASCSTSSHNQLDPSSMVDTCRCNEIIVTQLSLLPVLLLDNECSTFDVELVQFQKAIKLCAGALACTCPGKDYTSILTISMLIARIVSVVERSGAPAAHIDDVSSSSGARSFLATGGPMTPVPSPKFSVGIYEIEGEDENNLKREVWWIQIRKVESLVTGFREMVQHMAQQWACRDGAGAPAAAWEQLVLVLEQKVQAVKRDWRVYRDKS